MTDTPTISYRLEGLTKHFPGVVAVDHVNLEVRQAEIHGIIGKNGAGKSVLVNLIAGVLRPNEGTVWIGDQRIESQHYTPIRAHELGVSLIPQEPLFGSSLNVVDNLFMGHPIRGPLGLLDHARMRKQAHEIAEQLSIPATPHQRMRDLPIEDQQLLAFGKALFIEKARVILLDEITASLPQTRKDQLLRFLREAIRTQPHLSFTLISHHISEILEFCDRVTVMRDGRAVQTLNIAETTKEELAAWIVGDEERYRARLTVPAGNGHGADQSDRPAVTVAMPSGDGEVVIEARNLRADSTFDEVSFQVRRGEVLGLAGLDGSGKDEVLAALAGLMQVEAGVILLEGKPVLFNSPRQALEHGVAFLPKKREEQAIIHRRSVEENMLLPIYAALRTRWGLIDYRRSRDLARIGVELLNVKTPSLSTNIDHLSGGNRQKVVINRILNATPKVFLLNEPTRGVDLATKPEILRVIRQKLAAQSAVILTSESEEELIEVCDRILVFYRGKIRQSLQRNQPNFNVPEVYRSIQGVGLS